VRPLLSLRLVTRPNCGCLTWRGLGYDRPPLFLWRVRFPDTGEVREGRLLPLLRSLRYH
jgi:hypothetical protein